MPPKLALLISSVFCLYAFKTDKKRYGFAPTGLFWPTLWYLVVATHPIGYWLALWGVPIPGGSDDPTDGSLIDRTFFLALTLIGLKILSNRQFNWGAACRLNPWFTVFVAYMALSILWSHYPYVSFKRYIKLLGSVVMAMVILTNSRPLDSLFTVLRRCLYIHLPMSILVTRYFRNIGVIFDWSGASESWQGISTSKNTLGQMAMLGAVYFTWEIRRNWRISGWKNLYVVYLLMALFLLKGGPGSLSMTSLSVTLFAVFVFVRIQALRPQPEKVRPFVLKVFYGIIVLVAFVLMHSIFLFNENSIFGQMIKLLGRDITMTGRTDIWHDVYAAASQSPIVGVGFGGFWIGRVANIPWNEGMTWVLGQGHSGYVDLYLQLGIVGAVIFAFVVFSSLPPLFRSLAEDFDFGCFRITMFLTILFIDMTESVYLRGDHHLWLILEVAILTAPATAVAGLGKNAGPNMDYASPVSVDIRAR